MTLPPSDLIRWRWSIRGQVQGVGFRPFVFRLADELGLTGAVLNSPAGVTLEVQGTAAVISAFAERLAAELPPLARIDQIAKTSIKPVPGEAAFVIAASASDAPAEAAVTVDTAVCADCRRELFDPADRRHGYGLINCTNCGPRLSIIRRVPYDRPNTTMAAFPLCPACAGEYGDPRDRRFHAQPVACPACGPRVWLREAGGSENGCDPYAAAAAMLADGKIVAIKGLGGFHLAVRADQDAAVGRLRVMKQRDAKPFALMCRDVAAARRLVTLSPDAERELTSPRAPIVLALRRPDACVAACVAPGNHRLGVMLPYMPMHHLLFAALDPIISTLVMTSGNVTDEPIAIDNAEAVERLGGIVDGFLLHDRPIERAVDDSVLLDAAGQVRPIRRSRGYVPVPMVAGIRHCEYTHGLCVGAELKNTIAVVRGGEAVLSQHIGDLSTVLAVEHFRRAVADLLVLFGVSPEFVAHDLHPGYVSTQAAREIAGTWKASLVGVQHHHAHAAAVLAEHGVDEPALALVCDGTGYGDDGTIWGGELLRVGSDGSFTRLARLRPIRLPGGDAAATDTRRPAMAMLHAAYGDGFADLPAACRLVSDDQERAMLAAMIKRGVSSPWTSSTGRLFDGVAALLGACGRNGFEAQAGITLEAMAHGARCAGGGADAGLFVLRPAEALTEIDLAALTRHIVEESSRGVPPDEVAWRFHWQLAMALSAAVQRAIAAGEPAVVGLSGGVFCNALLTEMVVRCLERAGARVLTHRQNTPNDGSVAFGQAVVALQRRKSTRVR